MNTKTINAYFTWHNLLFKENFDGTIEVCDFYAFPRWKKSKMFNDVLALHEVGAIKLSEEKVNEIITKLV